MSGFGGISGISSGIVWADMIDQIMALDARAVAAQRARAQTLDARSSAWEQLRLRISTLRERARLLRDGAFTGATATVAGSASPPIAAAASASATPGTWSVRVLARATAERVAGIHFAARDSALAVDGAFLVNGTAVHVDAADSLDDVAAAINAAGAGARASIIQTAHGHRLVLAAVETGAGGLDLVDGDDGVLRQLGVFGAALVVKHRTSAGFRSDALADSTAPVASLRALGGSGTVWLGAGTSRFSVDIDLAAMSLDDIAAAINAAAGAATSPVGATVVQTPGGRFALDISGTAAFTDDGGVLEVLGLVQRSRDDVAHQIAGGILTASNGVTPADAGTLLTDLRSAGAPGLGTGAALTFQGTRHDGSAFSFSHVISGGDTVQTLLDRINGADGFDGSAVASIAPDGSIYVTSTSDGASAASLAAWADDPAGGALDFGTFAVTTPGLSRQLALAEDALVEIDGVRVTSSSNDIRDVVPGLSLSLLGVDPDTEYQVSVSRDVDAAVRLVQDFVEALNAVTDFVHAGAGTGGSARPPLAGDALARNVRTSLRAALDVTIDPADGHFARISEVGVSIDRNGRFSVDAAKLRDAIDTDERSVATLFGAAFGAQPAAGGGVAATMYAAADALLQTGSGISAIRQRLADSVASIHRRADALQERLDRRRDDMARRFAAMEQALARAQAQSAWLASQLNSLFANTQT